MDVKTLTKTSALVAAMAFALSLAAAGDSQAQENEKCYGIAKAGKNDCKTAGGSCAGTAKKDKEKDSFLLLPKGTCDKIAGGSVTPAKM